MIRINENEVLGYCYRTSGNTGKLLMNTLTLEEAKAIQMALSEFLYNEASSQNNGFVSFEEVDAPELKDFKSILYRGKAAGKTNKIIAFNFRAALTDTILPLLGVVISIVVGTSGLGTIAQAGTILKTLWGKLNVLKLPGDEVPIRILEALLAVKAKNISEKRDKHPSTQEIEAESTLDHEAFKQGLARLKTLGIISAQQWAGQKEDMTNPDNKWKISF